MTEAAARSLDTRLGAAKTAGFSVQAGDVVRHLSHELRQPLSAIESIAYYLGMVLPEEHKITLQLERLRQLVEQMDWSLTDAVHMLQAAPLNPQILDLNEIVSHVLADRPWRDGPALRGEFSEVEALVKMDAAQASHLVRGMLLVMSHLPEDEHVVFRTRAADGRVSLDIHAPRVEIAPDDLERLFTPLAPCPPAGCLSLACAKRIAEAHGGEMEALSGPGLGVKFTCSFPMA